MVELNCERIITFVPTLLIEQIDAYRFAVHMPSRAEAIRRLLVSLATATAKKD